MYAGDIAEWLRLIPVSEPEPVSRSCLRILVTMARPKLDKSLADYMAIAITPALIMLLTGSLVWFLAELGYDGSRPQRIRWILFWFVVGAVLVARIAIENGRAHASIFLFGLAGATSLTIFKFAPDGPLVPIICLGIVAWCADKLTWDCTLIDESEDASGEGLLQVAGVADETELPGDEQQPQEAEQVDAQDETSTRENSDSEESSARSRRSESVPFWKRLFVNESERAGQPHAPGLWVVYFSLAALPLYGFGQLWIPVTDVESRHFAFQCLLVYVGAALGLLLMTSFLGLRRYLRQRNLEMPAAMAATWVGMGSAIAIGILVVAMLLPRPQGDYSIAEAIDSISEEVQEASDWAFLDDDGGEGEGQPSGPADENAEQGSTSDADVQPKSNGQQPGNQVAQAEPQNAQNGDNGSQPGDSGNGDPGKGEQNAGASSDQNQQTAENDDNTGERQQASSDQPTEGTPTDQSDQGRQPPDRSQQADQQLAQNNPDQSTDSRDGNHGDDESASDEAAASDETESPDPPTPDSDDSWLTSLAENAGTLFKWLIYGALVAGMVYLMIRNWPAVVAFLRNFWQELLGMFGRKPATVSASPEHDEELETPVRPFSEFPDPFRSGLATRSSPGELVRYTFEALQAWALENNCGRTPDQTPMEFGQRMQARRLKISNEAHEVSQLYAQMAYGGLRPDETSVATLQKLWRKLS